MRVTVILTVMSGRTYTVSLASKRYREGGARRSERRRDEIETLHTKIVNCDKFLCMAGGCCECRYNKASPTCSDTVKMKGQSIGN